MKCFASSGTACLSKDDPELVEWVKNDTRFFTDHDVCFTNSDSKKVNFGMHVRLLFLRAQYKPVWSVI